jgi:hypothetical protein
MVQAPQLICTGPMTLANSKRTSRLFPQFNNLADDFVTDGFARGLRQPAQVGDTQIASTHHAASHQRSLGFPQLRVGRCTHSLLES